MQLTKDDLIDNEETGAEGIDLITFKQVVEFYDEFKNDMDGLKYGYPKLWCKYVDSHKENLYELLEYRDWLFSYCFKDGLK